MKNNYRCKGLIYLENESRCLIQLDGGDGVLFLGNYGERTPNLQEALIFRDELAAHIYIDKHGLNRLARVRRIIKEA